MDIRLVKDIINCQPISWWAKDKNITENEWKLIAKNSIRQNVDYYETTNDIGWKNCFKCKKIFDNKIYKFYAGFVKAVEIDTGESRIMFQIQNYNKNHCICPSKVGSWMREFVNSMNDYLEISLKRQQLILERNVFRKRLKAGELPVFKN